MGKGIGRRTGGGRRDKRHHHRFVLGKHETVEHFHARIVNHRAQDDNIARKEQLGQIELQKADAASYQQTCAEQQASNEEGHVDDVGSGFSKGKNPKKGLPYEGT